MTQNTEKRTGTYEYGRFVARLIKSYGKKAREAEIDVTSLTQLKEIQDLLDEEISEVAQALNADGFSWAQIGEALGMDRSNAAKRYGRRRS